jgi:membrane associated rhomboid family serine protease
VLPLRDTLRHERAPLVTWLVIAANAIAFAYELALDDAGLRDLVELCGIVPARYFDPEWARWRGFPAHDAWPFLASQFLHGGWLHLVSNMWSLAIFGDNVEDRLGSLRFLALYVASGVAAGLVHLATNYDSRVPTIGASGAIAGVMGAYFVLFPRARVITLVPIGCWPLVVELPAVIYLGFWFLLQFFSGTAALASAGESSGIAWWAHIGGFLAGILLLRALSRRRRPRRTAA